MRRKSSIMILGLTVTNGKPKRLFGRLTAVFVLAAFIALSLNCFACDFVSVPVPAPLAGNCHLHGGEKAQQHNDADHCQQHDDTSFDCCSSPVSMVYSSIESIYKAAAPLPSSTQTAAIISVSKPAIYAAEIFYDEGPPDKLSRIVIPISSLSHRAPPLS